MKRSGLVILACVGALASANAVSINNTAPETVAEAQNKFVEIAGSMEFSGRLIVRPLQLEALADRGLDQNQVADTIKQAKQLVAQYDEHWYEPLVDHHVINIPAGETENTLAAKLMATGLFEFVEPDWILYPVDDCTSDDRLPQQWHHNADRMQSCDAWDINTGDPSVTVGICDTGIQTGHPEFQLHRKEGYNAANRQWEGDGGQIGPVHPHGTNTTGCAAANGDNGTGVAGVGWNLSHRMMRVSNSSSGSASLSTLTHGALTSIQSGDKVANVSYSGVTSSSVRSTATQIKNLGGLLTWSAGNDNGNRNWGDRDNDDVIVVGATGRGDSKASFSAYGASVDLVAPGASVYTTNTGSGYGGVSGTSFSAPLTAGLIALIWSTNPDLTPDEVEAILKQGCDDLGTNGVDNTYGYGRINAFNSLILAGGVPGGDIPVPFLEEFTTDTLSEEIWEEGTNTEVSTEASNEPSDPYSLNIHSDGSIATQNFLMAAAPPDTFVSFYTQRQGVESGKQFIAEYYDIFGNWTEIVTLVSDGNDQSSFEFHQMALAFDAYHDDFAVRFRALGFDDSDDWFVDDLRVGEEFDGGDGCYADFNGDGSVNTQDVLAYLNAYGADDASADCNEDGTVNSQDVICFLNVWNAGC